MRLEKIDGRVVQARQAAAQERRVPVAEDRRDQVSGRHLTLEHHSAPEFRRERHGHELARHLNLHRFAVVQPGLQLVEIDAQRL
jgi:hypothetical protein